MTEVSRRALIKATGAIGAAILPAGAAIETADAKVPVAAKPAATSSFCAASAPPTTYVFFNSEEAAFIEAAVARLIPADEEWPGALEACAPNYIDKQLAGAWGAGERLYRSGPWQHGAPRDQQGVVAHSVREDEPRRPGQLSEETRGGRPRSRRRPRRRVLRASLGEHARGLLQRPGLWRQLRHGELADDRVSRRLRLVLRPDRQARDQARPRADEPRGGRARACP